MYYQAFSHTLSLFSVIIFFDISLIALIHWEWNEHNYVRLWNLFSAKYQLELLYKTVQSKQL